MAGAKREYAGNSPAILPANGTCPHCKTGRLIRSNNLESKCINCSRIFETAFLTLNGKCSHLLNKWEQNQIIDALREQYMRAAGNARRTKYESSRVSSLEQAGKIETLIDRIKQWSISE